MTYKTQKLILGLAILLLVDVLWVSTTELTKFAYDNDAYAKPFFCIYFKTAMFTIYLVIIAFIAPWKDTCERYQHNNNNYLVMDQTTDADENYYTNHPSLSDPTFIPINGNNSSGDDNVSGTESDDSSVRSVRFSKLAEVREMSAHEATEALMARLSYSASMRMKRHKSNHKTAKLALLFSILWFAANYFMQASLENGQTAMASMLGSSSTLFTLVLASCFPSPMGGDKFSITKLIAVILNIGGVVLITVLDLHNTKFTRGSLLALFSAFFYAVYFVFAKRKGDTEDKLDIPLFFGFIGLWSLILMWPIFFILHFTAIEVFVLPNQKQFIVLFLNGLVGTVISEALRLWGCFLTSSLVSTLAVSLQIPISIVFDVLLKQKTHSIVFYIGMMPIVISLILVALLTSNDDSDPIMRLLKAGYRKICRCEKPSIVRINEDEQHESLISNND